MVTDDKEKLLQSEAQVLGWTTDFFSNPDTLGLSLDKSALNVLLATWIYDDNGDLTTRSVATKVYDAGIRKGLWLLGNEALAAIATVTPEINIWQDKQARKILFYNKDSLNKILFSKYKNKIKKFRQPLLNQVLASNTFTASLFVLRYYNELFKPAEHISKININEVKSVSDNLEKELEWINSQNPVNKIPVLAKTKYLSLLNDLYDLGIPYDNTIKNILEKLKFGYEAITAKSFSDTKIKTKGKLYWMKEPKFYYVWNKRRNELLEFFDNKLKETNQKDLAVSDLLAAYDATVTSLYSSEKVAEFYQLPVAIAQKYPHFRYAFDAKRYYSEVLFDYMLIGHKAYLELRA